MSPGRLTKMRDGGAAIPSVALGFIGRHTWRTSTTIYLVL